MMELYLWTHLSTGESFTVFQSVESADKQLAELNAEGEVWKREPFFDAILDEEPTNAEQKGGDA